MNQASGKTGPAAGRKPLPPVWLMGLTMTVFGAFGGVWAIATPQLLAADHVSEPTIATVTTLVLLPGVFGFLLCPILDVWISRRSWAALTALATGVLVAGALLSHRNLALFTVFLLLASLTSTFYQGALGGWLASLLGDEKRASLGAWITVGNIGGGGLMAMAAMPLLRGLPSPLGAIAIGAAIVSPLAIFPFLPAPPPDERLSHEGLLRFLADVRQVIVQPKVLRLVLIFGAPAAAFALTNTLSGFGAQFGASETFISLVGGAGVMIAGIVGSLLAPRMIRWVPPVRLYLLIGVTGAIFTLGLCLAPRVPVVLAAGLLGENIFQSAAFAASNAITYWSLGKDNPLAATQVAVLTAASVAPITYMQYVDGHAYAFRGPTGSFLADALISLGAGAALFLIFRRFSAQAAPAVSQR